MMREDIFVHFKIQVCCCGASVYFGVGVEVRSIGLGYGNTFLKRFGNQYMILW